MRFNGRCLRVIVVAIFVLKCPNPGVLVLQIYRRILELLNSLSLVNFRLRWGLLEARAKILCIPTCVHTSYTLTKEGLTEN